MVKVYNKKGNLNYKERKYIAAIQKKLQDMGVTSEQFNPANNFEELEQLYNQYGIEDAQFVEVKDESSSSASSEEVSNEDKHKQFRDAAKQSMEASGEEADVNSFVDPFNREEPIVRDYVHDTGLKDESKTTQTVKTTFEEPTTFKDSFEMPNDSEEESGGGRKNSPSKRDKEVKKSDPINPSFDTMDNAKKRKSTKRMAKAIVEGVCKLAEFGCVWWVTKDITEDKLTQYEIEDTVDLQILLTLDEGQQVTVRNWFSRMVKDANDVLKIGDDEKAELADSLYEVMLEKGIAPTPMQELIINAVSTIVIGLGVKAYAMGKQITDVLSQLKSMKAAEKEAQQNDELRQTADYSQQTTTQAPQQQEVEVAEVMNESEGETSTDLVTVN